MAFFQPPEAPTGFDYVVRNNEFVLVPKSELTENIVPATGRTWAEEARLYNIKNAPDGKNIAKFGDQFYQTAESMKNRGDTIKSISAGSLKFLDQMRGSGDTFGPNLAETLDKIKSGDINADIGGAFDSVGDDLPSSLKGLLSATKADIIEKIAKAQEDLPKLTAIAQANQDLVSKTAVSKGKAPTQAELKAAAGALAIFEDGPALLEQQAKAIGDSIKDIGTTTIAGLSQVPRPTVPNLGFDPDDPGSGPETFTNPEYTLFAEQNPETAASFQNVLGKIEGASGALGDKFAEITDKAAEAAADGVAALKAFAFAAQLSQPVTGLAAAARSLSVNPGAFDAGQISKAISLASKLGPSIDTSLLKGTKDEDLTYTGDDGIVWDRINTERERRGLPGLASLKFPRPDEPPLVPAGATPPKPPDTVFLKAKSVGLDEGPLPKIKATKAVFEKNPDDIVSKDFVDQYYKIYAIWEAAVTNLEGALQKQADAYYPGWSTIRPQSAAILADKPDASDRTAREVLIIEEVNKLRPLIQENAEFFKRYTWTKGRQREIQPFYGSIRQLYLDGATYGQISPAAENVLTKDGGPPDYKQFIGKTYKSFESWKKDNPGVDLSFIGKSDRPIGESTSTPVVAPPSRSVADIERDLRAAEAVVAAAQKEFSAAGAASAVAAAALGAARFDLTGSLRRAVDAADAVLDEKIRLRRAAFRQRDKFINELNRIPAPGISKFVRKDPASGLFVYINAATGREFSTTVPPSDV